jgi:N-acetylglutamate synthase-like GNAT family acetyltransferase
MVELRKAEPEDRDMLIALLWENEMAYVDPVEHYILAVNGKEIIGCGRLEDHESLAMVRPVVVSQEYRRQGIGRLLLKGIMPVDRPTVLVARHESVQFYEALGFSKVEWEMIPLTQQEECASCPHRLECQPQPMACKLGLGS